MGDKLFIFDIDSALDKLEDDLINNEVKPKVNYSESQQQKVENDGNNDESISASEENNGNESSANESLSDVLLDSKYALHKRIQRKILTILRCRFNTNSIKSCFIFSKHHHRK